MEINSTTLYLFTLCDSANDFITEVQALFALLCVIVTFVVFVQKLNNPNNPPRTLTKLLLFFFIPFFVCTSCVKFFLPSTREMAAIVILPKVLNNEKLNAVSSELYSSAMEWMKELKPKSKKSYREE